MAMGEDIEENQAVHEKRACDIIAIITFHLLTGFFREGFLIEDLSLNGKKWPYKNYFVFRLLRKALNTKNGRLVYCKSFLLLLPLLKRRRPFFEGANHFCASSK